MNNSSTISNATSNITVDNAQVNINNINENEDTEYYPPENFSLVSPLVYRSGFPKKKHFQFLKKLKLKSVLTLVLEDYPLQNLDFYKKNQINFFQFGVAGNKEPFVDIKEEVIRDALLVLLVDEKNHPILVHCNKGKHRTGCLIGCLRKMQGWTITSIFNEYRLYAYPKERAMDQQFIELFESDIVHRILKQNT